MINVRVMFCLTVLLSAPVALPAQWVNSLQPVGKPAGKLTVVKAGQAQAVIVLPRVATAPEQSAAAQLQHWIQEMTGTKLGITNGPPTRRAIMLQTDPTLGGEGYEIAFKRGCLVLSGGTTRGVLNAVYALLEEDLGCRFYAEDSIRLPRTNLLVLAPPARCYIPRLKIRDPFYAAAFNREWSVRNRSNSPNAPVPEAEGGHTDYAGMFVHTAAQMVPADKHFKDHPDYFAQKADGTRHPAQLCATHPEVAGIVIAYLRQMLRDHPHAEILSVSKNDNPEVCHCDRCRKLRDAEGSDMACQLVLVNQAADALAASHPELIIDTLAYLETIQVPKTLRPRANVAIRLCNDAVGAWTYPFKPAGQCAVAGLASAWSAVHHRLYIWDYNVNFSHYLAPMPNLDIMAANIRFWIQHHAEGVMLQGGYQGPAERDQLKCWVTAKLLWNPAWDERALEKDFIWGHYENAAPMLEEYENLLRQMRSTFSLEMDAPAGGIRYPMDAPFFTKDFITRAEDIFGRARAAAHNDPALLRKVERAELPLLYLQCARGPELTGPAYARAVGEFERIARREGVQYLQEGGPDFESKLAGYKAAMAKSAAPN